VEHDAESEPMRDVDAEDSGEDKEASDRLDRDEMGLVS
jgi:hypothetical protein